MTTHLTMLNMNRRNRVRLLAIVVLTAEAAFAQFVQSAPKLVGSGAMGGAAQGQSVAISGDGRTVIVGGPVDGNYSGAAWVFTQAGGSWTQQGGKLVGTGGSGQMGQGNSVALSTDGNTAIIGGPYDNGSRGAAWIYVRSGGVWLQQGSKLVGTAGGPGGYQGYSVALSADGNTVLVGAPLQNEFIGAAYVFVRSGGVWTQQARLVGSGIEGQQAFQGGALALSADGNTALVGGPYDNGNAGAAWVFVRSGSAWTQQGSKLVERVIADGLQGYSVALSADGNTAVLGSKGESSHSLSGLGGAWVYVRSGGVWTQQGGRLTASGIRGQGDSIALSSDGNTILVGAAADDAAVSWSRSGNTWTQNSAASHSETYPTGFGASAALSADGRTAILGAPADGQATGVNIGSAFILGIPDLAVSMTHAGSFRQGDSGAYLISINNIGNAPELVADVTIVLPAALTPTAISGVGWNCSPLHTCTRVDALPAGSSYPPLTVTVDVAPDAPQSVNASATVSTPFDGNPANNYANDPTNIVQMPDLTTSKTHAGDFVQGDTGRQYSITVRNSGYGPTAGTVTVTDTLPDGLIATALTGAGWSCILASRTCTRADSLAAGNTYPGITLTVNVASNAAARLTNIASVSGGGEIRTGNNYFSDFTAVIPLVNVTFKSSPLPFSVIVDGVAYAAPSTLKWAAGSSHSIATTSPQTAGPSVQFLFNHWSDGGAMTHSVIAPSAPATFTAFFDEQFLQQTINFSAIPDKTLGDPPFSLAATPSSGLPVHFGIVSGPATLSGSTITLTGLGTVSVQATQPGDQWYAAAPAITRSFRVLPASVVLSLTASPFAGGSVSANPANAGNLYSPGTTVQVQAQANPGFIFTGFSGALSGMTNPRSLVMTQAAAVTANFAPLSTEHVTFGVLSGAPLPDSQTISLAGSDNITPVMSLPASGGAWLSAALDPPANPTGLRLSLNAAGVAGLSTGTYVSYVVLGAPPGQRVITVTLAVNTATIDGILDAAGYQSGGFVSEGLFTIFGANLAVQARSADTLAPGSLGGTTVTITDSAGVARQATLLYVSPTQVNLLAPAGLAPGAGTLTVENGAGGSGSTGLQVAAVWPGLFSAGQTGKGVAAAVVMWVRPEGEITTALAAGWDSSSGRWLATPIDVTPSAGQVYLSLYGTGIRRRSSLSGVTATVGGIPVEVLFAGAQSQYAGVDQVNITLPPSLAGMGEAEIRLTVDGRIANPVSIALR